jgi:NTE family protein
MTHALVLSGGGSVGIAWQSGLVVGLAKGGIDLREMDRVIGTSAGSAVGAQIRLGRDLADQVARYRGGSQPRGASSGRTPGRSGGPSTAERMAKFTVWDGQDGVELDRAVASSCAVPGLFPPITINGRRYVDGAVRSGTNADLAKGCDRAVVLTLVGGSRPGVSAEWTERLRRATEQELEAIRSGGGEVATISPDDQAAAATGVDLMDGTRLLEAAEHGIRQGQAEADRLRQFLAG